MEPGIRWRFAYLLRWLNVVPSVYDRKFIIGGICCINRFAYKDIILTAQSSFAIICLEKL